MKKYYKIFGSVIYLYYLCDAIKQEQQWKRRTPTPRTLKALGTNIGPIASLNTTPPLVIPETNPPHKLNV